MSRRFAAPLLFAAGLLALAACSDDGASVEASADTATTQDGSDAATDSPDTSPVGDVAEPDLPDEPLETDLPDEPPETEPPAFRDVRVSIGGDFPSEVDLSRRDQERVLPVPTPASFRIFVTDNETIGESLVVDVVDVEGDAPLADQTKTFRTGLWVIDTTLHAGRRLEVQARDEAGNVARSEFGLLLPTQEEAIDGSWEIRFYDVDQSLEDAWEAVWSDGEWCEDRSDPEDDAGGTYRVEEDGTLRVATRHRMSCDTEDYGAEWDSIESERVAAFHVDGTYFSETPFERTAGSGSVAGTWERSYQVYLPGADGPELAETVTEVLELGSDDEWVETHRTVDHGDGDAEITRTRSGTWQLSVNDDYVENYGDFLDRTVTAVDGVAVDPERRFDLFVIRAGRLLIRPALRAEGSE